MLRWYDQSGRRKSKAMSISAQVLPPPLREGDRLTRDEFLRRWEGMPDLQRAELIDGIVYMPSPVSNVHSDFHFLLNAWLGFYAAVTPGCKGGTAGTWLMSNDGVPQPDLDLCIQPQRGGQSRVEGAYPAGAPELIVELSHTTFTRDSGVKLRLYERSGVREYLIVRPEKKQAIWRELTESGFRMIEPGADGLLRSRIFPGLWLDPQALWDGSLPALSAVVQRGTTSSEHARFVERLASAKP
jgi:Uma2 family endonuclease